MARGQNAKRRMKQHYAKVAAEMASACPVGDRALVAQAIALGYTEDDIRCLPRGALVLLGCGNPLAAADVQAGETVLDLGSGGGRDAFIAARSCGRGGRVIGVDMTPEMVERARLNATEGQYANVVFTLAELERLPLEDDSVDCVISNCVINHSPDQAAVFREAFRVLKQGGRLAVSDLVVVGELSQAVRRDLQGTSVCIAASLEKQQYLRTIESAGFRNVVVLSERPFSWPEMDQRLAGKLASVQVKARK